MVEWGRGVDDGTGLVDGAGVVDGVARIGVDEGFPSETRTSLGVVFITANESGSWGSNSVAVIQDEKLVLIT